MSVFLIKTNPVLIIESYVPLISNCKLFKNSGSSFAVIKSELFTKVPLTSKGEIVVNVDKLPPINSYKFDYNRLYNPLSFKRQESGKRLQGYGNNIINK